MWRDSVPKVLKSHIKYFTDAKLMNFDSPRPFWGRHWFFIKKNWTNQNWAFFILKIFSGGFNFAKFLLSPLARFARDVHIPLVHVSVCAWRLLQRIHSKKCFSFVLLFTLCSYTFFWFCMCKISVAIILLGLFLRFVACFEMRRAKSIVRAFTS